MKDALSMIAAGRHDAALLGNCRLEWGQGEAYGEEAIGELFRNAPLALGSGTLVETPTALAWIGSDAALVADIYDGHIGRLWRIGAGAMPVPEPAVAVAFDPDLHQQRGAVHFRAEDHLHLAPGAADAIAAAADQLLDRLTDASMHRARAFVVRAFSGEAGSVALFAVHLLAGGAVRSATFIHAVALIDDRGTQLVIDPATASRDWMPRL